jgi:hypothetical protein
LAIAEGVACALRGVWGQCPQYVFYWRVLSDLHNWLVQYRQFSSRMVIRLLINQVAEKPPSVRDHRRRPIEKGLRHHDIWIQRVFAEVEKRNHADLSFFQVCSFNVIKGYFSSNPILFLAARDFP